MQPPQINLNELKRCVFDDSIAEDPLEQAQSDEFDDVELLLETPEVPPVEITPEVIKELDELLQAKKGFDVSSAGLREIHDNNARDGFVKFSRDDEIIQIRKSSLLWMMTTPGTKLSTDRNQRFVENDDKAIANDRSIKIGDFIKVKWLNKEVICSVINFKFQNAKYKFTKNFCPIKHKNGPGQGVNMFVDFYRTDGNFLVKTDDRERYIDIDSFIDHLKTTRDNLTQKYVLVW